MLDAEGRHAPEPVEVPLGDDPYQLRVWIRCAGAACRARVEVLVYCGDIPDTEAARAERLGAVLADLPAPPRCGPCACGRRSILGPSDEAPKPEERAHASATVFVVHRPQTPPPKPLPPRPLPVEIRNLVRSGRAPSPAHPRGDTLWWTRAQDALRALYDRTPADFASMLPELLAELRQLRGWYPYWTDFLRTYLDLTRSTR